MNSDALFQIMLQSHNIETLCAISQSAQTISQNKSFWLEKIESDGFDLIFNDEISYLSQYLNYKEYLKIANNIITICEKERIYDQKHEYIIFNNEGYIHLDIPDDGIKQFKYLYIPKNLLEQILDQTDKKYYMISLSFTFTEDNIYRVDFLVSTEEEDGQGEYEAVIHITVNEMRKIIISALQDNITNIHDLMGNVYIPVDNKLFPTNYKNHMYYNSVKLKRIGMLMILNDS